MRPATLLKLDSKTDAFLLNFPNFKKTYFGEHLLIDAFINERQQETHAFLGKKNESHLVNKGNECFPKITIS